MNTISPLQIELELRELRKKLLCRDLINYIFNDEVEPDTEKYDFLIKTNPEYKYNEKDYLKFKNIKRFKCF